jgi:hypothetical protein
VGKVRPSRLRAIGGIVFSAVKRDMRDIDTGFGNVTRQIFEIVRQ